MKRGKDDEKMMGPMFPRLHVNDTEKGGPRAPPRNKMALYEQFTIPSQRCNSVVVPPKQNNSNGSSLVPSASTSQGTSRGRNTYLHLYRPPSAPAYEEIQVHNAEALSLNNQLVRAENKKKPLEEDDFMVPIFSEAGSGMCIEKRSQNGINGEEHPVSKQQIKDKDENTLRVSASSRNSLDISIRRRDDIPWQKGASLLREHQEKDRLVSLENSGACLIEDHGDSLPIVDAMNDEDVPDLQAKKPFKDTSLRLRVNPQAGCRFRGDNEINNGIDRIEGDRHVAKATIDKDDGVSETSMVDSASEFDITPDDVVDKIGRKHFWKARSAIVNQQRVFAVQVFELHRLLKVQKLIAGSPNLLLEASDFVGKTSVNVSAVKKYSSEYVVKDLPLKDTQKDVAHKSIDKMEGTAENVVPKVPAPVPSQQHPIQPANMDPKMNPWVFHQPSSHQWLMPIMTPYEGFVYKPFPAPGFMDPVCGGCGPVGPNPVSGNLMNPTYGMPPGIHFGGQSYFPPYGMQLMSPSVSGSTMIQPNLYNSTGQPEGASVNSGQQNVMGSHTGEVQGSTASSPSDRAQVTETVPLSEGREKRAKVIRVVPHRSTRESAARIFQSIQDERRVYESS